MTDSRSQTDRSNAGFSGAGAYSSGLACAMGGSPQ
jgi:hypothetical protein